MGVESGAVGGNRTHDLTLTKGMLYQLSYNGENKWWGLLGSNQ